MGLAIYFAPNQVAGYLFGFWFPLSLNKGDVPARIGISATLLSGKLVQFITPVYNQVVINPQEVCYAVGNCGGHAVGR
jgi:hypothetical protein